MKNLSDKEIREMENIANDWDEAGVLILFLSNAENQLYPKPTAFVEDLGKNLGAVIYMQIGFSDTAGYINKMKLLMKEWDKWLEMIYYSSESNDEADLKFGVKTGCKCQMSALQTHCLSYPLISDRCIENSQAICTQLFHGRTFHRTWGPGSILTVFPFKTMTTQTKHMDREKIKASSSIESNSKINRCRKAKVMARSMKKAATKVKHAGKGKARVSMDIRFKSNITVDIDESIASNPNSSTYKINHKDNDGTESDIEGWLAYPRKRSQGMWKIDSSESDNEQHSLDDG
ncbi:hypothetical protein NEOLEDRAFT_1152260 [Neolentinus lepideus HHB14362 ss-1]|uniref:Uncharacterized protein n=1 Tax=Neolentinus lepideus HHB14362 ss-1 TaxID=1314782 RepID=A0A165MZ26_9AGAM|nr:hypothetical protein NEOLEDRAFT_1152260 [Neolentinus lepideus HHB14362 ss-1]